MKILYCPFMKKCLSQLLPIIFILQLWRNIPLKNTTSIVLFLTQEIHQLLVSYKPSQTINPVYLPQTTPQQHKERGNQKTLIISTLAQEFYPATWEEHPKKNHDPDRLVLESMPWKEMHQLLHTTWGKILLKGIFLTNFWNLYKLYICNNLLLNCGRYVDRSSRSWPTETQIKAISNGFDLGFSTTLQGARLENFLWFDQSRLPSKRRETATGCQFCMGTNAMRKKTWGANRQS